MYRIKPATFKATKITIIIALYVLQRVVISRMKGLWGGVCKDGIVFHLEDAIRHVAHRWPLLGHSVPALVILKTHEINKITKNDAPVNHKLTPWWWTI